MNLDAAALWFAIKSEADYAKVKAAGINDAMLVGAGKAAWTFVDQYRKEHSVFPPASLIQEQTNLKVTPVEEGVTIDFISSKLRDRMIFNLMDDEVGKTLKFMGAGNQDEAVKTILGLADAIRRQQAGGAKIYTLGEVVPAVWDLYQMTKSGTIGVPFPWPTMNAMTMGMWGGTLTFFVARPGTGKTFCLINICCFDYFNAGKKVLVVSPEMGRVELAERIVVMRGKFNYSDVVSGQLGTLAEKKYQQDIEAMRVVDGFYILDDEERLNPSAIEDAIEIVKPDLVAIDSIYMLMVEQGKIKSGPGSKGGKGERVMATVDWMRRSSRRTNIPWLGMSQLSRTGRMKGNAKEIIKKGTGTGGIEDTVAWSDQLLQDAHDLFAMYQDEDMKLDKQMIIVPLKMRRQASQRHVFLRWDLEEMDFSEIGSKEVSSKEFEDKDYDDCIY